LPATEVAKFALAFPNLPSNYFTNMPSNGEVCTPTTSQMNSVTSSVPNSIDLTDPCVAGTITLEKISINPSTVKLSTAEAPAPYTLDVLISSTFPAPISAINIGAFLPSGFVLSNPLISVGNINYGLTLGSYKVQGNLACIDETYQVITGGYLFPNPSYSQNGKTYYQLNLNEKANWNCYPSQYHFEFTVTIPGQKGRFVLTGNPGGTNNLNVESELSGSVPIVQRPIQPDLLPPLKPLFGPVSLWPNEYTVQITNYDPRYTWKATDDLKGFITISSTGLLIVSGLPRGFNDNFHVTSYPPNSAPTAVTPSQPLSGTPTSTSTSLQSKANNKRNVGTTYRLVCVKGTTVRNFSSASSKCPTGFKLRK